MKKNKKLYVTGIEPNNERELKRAFDFENAKVDEKYKIPEKLFLKKNCLKVSGDGVFYTLQGEGISMGMPATFLRLHICNLRCVWCDAWYTWNPNTKQFWTESQDWTIKEAKDKIVASWECENRLIKKRLVITGGEPLIQRDRIDQLIKMLPRWEIEIETNGTIMPTDLMLNKCQFNCSPKLKNSGNPYTARVKKSVLARLNKANTMFKFVVMTNEDLDEIDSDFIKGCSLDVRKVVVMPQGVTAEEVQKNARRVVEKVKKKGYRLLGRLQCDIWGARRRV